MTPDEEQVYQEALETMWRIELRNTSAVINDWPAADRREWLACYDLRREVKERELKR